MSDPSIIKQSVTSGDYAETPAAGAIYFAVYSLPYRQALPPTLEGLSIRESDYVTISTLDHESLWAGSVATAITKLSCAAWEVEGDIPLRNKRGQELLLGLDAGRGWVTGISKILQDFLLTRNGAFLEIVRATTSLNSQIIGLIPLDSLRCTRTGDPEKPVVYTDLKGRQHELEAEEVIEFTDMPSSRAGQFSTGSCAASRAYPAIYKLAAVETYISDKVTGRRPLAVNLINGLNDQQLRSVLQTAQSDADARGALAYMGAIIATVPGTVSPSVATIPLADFPDTFNRRDELDIAVLSYASNLGMDVQDIQPLTGRALGTGAQSVTLDEKAKGKGLASFRQQFVHAINLWVLPDLTTMAFIEKDWRDKTQQAEYNAKVEAYTADATKNGIITAQQGLQALVDENVYPDEFLPIDQTPDTALADTEKPETEQVDQPGASAPLAAEPTPAPVEEQAVTLAEKVRKGITPPPAEPQPEPQPAAPTPLSSGGQGIQLVIKRKQAPRPAERQEPGTGQENMPLAMAMMLMALTSTGKEMEASEFMKLSEWIASQREKLLPGPKAKQVHKEAPVQQGIEANVSQDEEGRLTITLIMPEDLIRQKDNKDSGQEEAKESPIVVNIPAPIVTLNPSFTMPSPVVNLPVQKPPVVNVNPKIEVNIPERRPGEFVVKRDNYGNVLGIEEKAS